MNTRPHVPRWRRTVAPLLLLVLLIACSIQPCTAYRMGDAVDTDIRYDSEQKNALRSQMPTFGVSSTADMVLPVDASQFSLQFEDGLRGLPWTFMSHKYNNNILKQLVVTFVYSKSGGGSIHSCQISNVVYETPTVNAAVVQTGTFRIQYVWVPEAVVHWQAGQAVMFLAVFCMSLFFVCFSCGLVDGGGGRSASSAGLDRSNNGDSSWNVPVASSSGSAVPKWD